MPTGRGVAAARVRGAAGRDGLRGGQPPGAQRGQEGGQHGQRQHPGRRQDRRPPRHVLAAHAVGVGRLMQHRNGQQVARHHPEHAPGQGGHADPAEVRHHDLRRGQADALQHADPVVPGGHRAADHVGHDEHRHDQADERERDHERLHDRAVAGVPALRGQPRAGPGHRARRECPCDFRQVGADLRGGACAGEPVQQLRARRDAGRLYLGHLGRRDPAVGGVGDGIGEPDHGQGDGVRQSGDRDRVAELRAEASRGAVQHDLARSGHPVSGGQHRVVHRAAP